MNIPLIAKPIIDQYTGDQKLEMWFNGHVSYVKAPFKHYFYSIYQFKNQICEEQVNKILFSTLQSTNLYRYSFQNTKLLNQYKEEDSIEAGLYYTDKVLIDEPDFFMKFPNSEPVKVLFFDIETDTTGMFPTPDRNAIIAIGCKCGNDKAIFMSETYNNDKIILNKFFDFIQKTDPDIITHYNGNAFDIPYCIERMKINNIPLNRWSRNKHDPHIYKETVTFGGRLSFDLYHEVQKDQTLFGIKNLKMKTVAKFLNMDKKLDIKEIQYSEMRSIVNTPILKKYLISDIEITELLFYIYFKNIEMLAEMNKIPLNLMMDASASFLPNIIHGRAFKDLNMVSDKMNKDRHPNYIKNKQGALTDTYNPGLYLNKVYKVDFSSEYPNIIRTFNLSPETTTIKMYNVFTGKYNFDITNPQKCILDIPDSVANKNIIIEINMEKKGFLTKFISDILIERFAIKKRMKEIKKDSSEYEYLHVRQNALKLVANIVSGYHGQEYSLYGDLGVYCAITGLGRFYLQLAMDRIKELSE